MSYLPEGRLLGNFWVKDRLEGTEAKLGIGLLPVEVGAEPWKRFSTGSARYGERGVQLSGWAGCVFERRLSLTALG